MMEPQRDPGSAEGNPTSLLGGDGRLRPLLESLPLAAALIAPDGRFELLNHRFFDAFGYTLEDLPDLATWWLRAYPSERCREEARRSWASAVDAAACDGSEARWRESRFVSKDGVLHAVEMSAARVGRETLVLLRDLTGRPAAGDEARLDDLRVRSALNIALRETTTLQELLDFALNEIVVVSRSKLGYIYFYDETTQLFTLHAWSRDTMAACSIPRPQTTYQLDQTGVWGEAVRQRRPVIVNDFTAPNALKRGYPEGHAPLSRFMTVPVIQGDRIVAVAGLANKATEYSEMDVRQLSLLMESIWLVAERRRAEDERDRMAATLRDAARRKDEFLAMLGHELRNPLAPIGNAAQTLRLLGHSDPRAKKSAGDHRAPGVPPQPPRRRSPGRVAHRARDDLAAQ